MCHICDTYHKCDNNNISQGLYTGRRKIMEEIKDRSVKEYAEMMRKIHKFLMSEDEYDKFKGVFILMDLVEHEDFHEAAYELALCYRDGNGVNKNIEECIRYLDIAASHGSAPAAATLGLYYIHAVEDSPVKEDYAKAIRLFEMAIKATDETSLYNAIGLYYLGLYYYNGQHGLKKDKKKGEDYIRLSAEKGFFPGCESYGDILSAREEFMEAISFYEKAVPKSPTAFQKMCALKDRLYGQKNEKKKRKRFWEI